MVAPVPAGAISFIGQTMKYRIGDLVKWTHRPDEELGIVLDAFVDVVLIVWCRTNIRSHYSMESEDFILIQQANKEGVNNG